MNRKQAVAQISGWSHEKIDPADQRRFIETAEAELMSLHGGNFARYQIRPTEFASWQDVWGAN